MKTTVKEFACLKKMGDALFLLGQVEEILQECEIFNRELLPISEKVSKVRFDLEQLTRREIRISSEVQEAEAPVDIRDRNDLERVVSETHILPP